MLEKETVYGKRMKIYNYNKWVDAVIVLSGRTLNLGLRPVIDDIYIRINHIIK